MLRILGIAFKATIFVCLVLVLGQLIHWKGRSVSDQVKSTLASAERSPGVRRAKSSGQALMSTARDSSATLLNDAREAIEKRARALPAGKEAASIPSDSESASAANDDDTAADAPLLSEEIPHGEREELNALLDI